MFSAGADSSEEWVSAYGRLEASNPRLEIRCAHPSEHERIYDLIDLAFGHARPRKEFDWLYRDNPNRLARCIVVVAKETGEIVSAEANFPWPIALGNERLDGGVVGDSVTHPNWQRLGLPTERRKIREGHPWASRAVSFGGPNAKTRAGMKKHGRLQYLNGPMPAAVCVFRSRPSLERLAWPTSLARPASAAVDLAFRSYRALALGGASDPRIQAVTRFDTGFDPVTERCMKSPRYWCPHGADFLNWRYLDHPNQTYLAFALVEQDRPIGYSVLRLADTAATLVEFSVAPEPRADARALLAHTLRYASDAGCPHVTFFAPAGWRHWPLLRLSGFLPYPSDYYFSGRGSEHEPEICSLANWQLVPGDRDFR